MAAPDLSELLGEAVEREPSTAAPTQALLREDVYARIRSWIIEGLLPPETRLRDRDIAEALEVSRTPVREALRRLQDEGLVVAEASRWTKVAPVDTGAADRLYPIIWTLERLAATMGAEWDERGLAALRAANERLASALSAQDAPRASLADTELHRLVVDAAGNPELSGIVADLKLRLRRIEIAYFGGSAACEPSVEEHRRAIAALEAGDLERAGEEIERNWRASLARLHERQA